MQQVGLDPAIGQVDDGGAERADAAALPDRRERREVRPQRGGDLVDTRVAGVQVSGHPELRGQRPDQRPGRQGGARFGGSSFSLGVPAGSPRTGRRPVRPAWMWFRGFRWEDDRVSRVDESPLARLEVAVFALVRWSESRHVRGEVARRSGCDLPSSELRLLEHFDSAEPMRVSDVAECMHVDISTVSLQLRRLRAERLVERILDPADRRVSRIAVTAEGRATVARVRAARRALLDEVLAGTGPAELDQAADVLLRVQEHMLEGMRAFPISR